MKETGTVKGIIFDLDGVICFTDIYHYRAWKQMADEEGIEFNEKINERLKGVSRAESLEIILERYEGPDLDSQQKQELMDRKNRIYLDFLSGMKPEDVEEDARRTLYELKKRGFSLAIGSSSKNTKYILEKVGLMDVFDAISDGTNITKSKPDPEVFLKAAEYLGIIPEECLVVEDAFSGIHAAKAAGMKAAGIGDASCCPEADYRISRLSELCSLQEVPENTL